MVWLLIKHACSSQRERERERDFGWLKARVQKKAFDWVLAAYKTRVQQSERERDRERERERDFGWLKADAQK